ncbi:YkvI family membrane protein [Lottiidibacillus patelloidae]
MGTIIGAGYASGRELWQFFGPESGLAITIFAVCFSICCTIIMKISKKLNTTHYIPLLEQLVGRKLTKIYDYMIMVYLFTTTAVMLAGGGATLEIVNVPYVIGIAIISLLVICIFFWDTKGILSINAILIPLLSISLIAILGFFYSTTPASELTLSVELANWPAAFTFTALNILPLVAILGAVGSEIKTEGEIWIASLGSGVILGGISLLYNESLVKVANDIMFYEIPLFAILKQYPYIMIIFMSVLLWAAIYTTAVSGVFGLTSRFRGKTKLSTWIVAGITILFMLPFTTFGFSTLVSFLYPIYGMLNLYILAAIIIYPIAMNAKS